MDVLQLIDRLEELVNSGMRFPLTSRAVIDEQQFLDIIDQLRVTVPEEFKQARRVSQEKDRVILQAESEAEKIINTAQQQATMMLQENELVRQAEARADEVIIEAQEKAEEICRGADNYALDVLSGLETELTKLLVTVRKGRATLDREMHRSADGHDNNSVREREEV